MRSARPAASFFADRKEPTMDRRPEADSGPVDEVARQRQKRSAARRDLGLDGTTEAARDQTVETLAHPSRGQQRLRTVAQLEALLLKD
jgi:hypothetical protein